MTGYESVMLVCAVGTLVVSVASFVLAVCMALDKKDSKSE